MRSTSVSELAVFQCGNENARPTEWKHGVTRLASGVSRFSVWAPKAAEVKLHLLGSGGREQSMEAKDNGYFEAILRDVGPGTRYAYRIGDRDLPDPGSRFQAEGVHGPSQVIDSQFDWDDTAWRGLSLDQYILYEIHVGTFTSEGTFDAIIAHLDSLKELGVTAVELMPVAQFPGDRNWGYDAVFPFAVQNSYGGPMGLKWLVNACHRRGLAVVLDVVYNHLGPEGNYLSSFGPYFTDKYKTLWGEALNFDGADSDEVRRYFVENALYWISEFHVDALRLDAIHAIHDESAIPFLEEIGDAVHGAGVELGRRVYVIAESDLNDTRILRGKSLGGMGLDAQWNDDFHHSLYSVLTGEQTGYYQDFGDLEHLAKAYREGYVYSGQYSAYRQHRHGNSSKELAGRQFVVFSQNHDQIGNRMLGERLTSLVSFEQFKLAAGAVLLSPFIPLLFMGEEYGETAPFLYFVSHSDAALIEAVRSGRKSEFSSFAWRGEPPDPEDESTFLRSKLNHELRAVPRNRALLDLYRKLIDLRRTLAPLALLSKEQMEVAVYADKRVLSLRRWSGSEEVIVLLCFASSVIGMVPKVSEGSWRKLVDSSDREWLGPGGSSEFWIAGSPLRLNPDSVVAYARV